MITSRDNQFIKEIRALQNKKERDLKGLFIIEGLRNAQEVLGTDSEITYVLYSEKLAENVLIKNLQAMDVPCYEVKAAIFDSLGPTRTSQGLIMAARKRELTAEQFFSDIGAKNLAILDHIQDPGNLGTILRSAWAAGLGGVIRLENSVDTYNPKVIRAAMGAVYHLPLITLSDEEAFSWLKSKNYAVLVADAGGEDYRKFNYQKPVAWLLGSEAQGPKAFWCSRADYTLSIPMARGVDSLNVAVAASILFFANIGEK